MIYTVLGIISGLSIIMIVMYIMRELETKRQYETFKRNVENYEKKKAQQQESKVYGESQITRKNNKKKRARLYHN